MTPVLEARQLAKTSTPARLVTRIHTADALRYD